MAKLTVAPDQRACVFFTIVARNYLAYALTLCQSVAAHHPGARICICVCDADLDADGEALRAQVGNVDIVSAAQLGLPNPEQFAFRYDVMEFCTAIKPYFFRWLFANTRIDKLVYLDPDILVVAPLVKVLDLLEQGASAVLTPHLSERVDDGMHPDEITMLRVGVYNLGFIALSRCAEATALVDWWCDRLERGAVVDLENGLFTDQKWADLMPCLFDKVTVLRDAGYNVAYWNLMHRRVSQADGEWLANEVPLSFVHFSGIDPLNPAIFSKHQNRYTQFSLKNVGDLKPIYLRYLDLLTGNGYAESLRIAYRYGFLADGARIHPVMRTYFRRYLDTGAAAVLQPFTTLRREFFDQAEPSLSGDGLVSRFMYGLYLHQRELQGVFNLKTSAGQLRYAEWFVEMASVVYGVDPAFVEPVRQRIQDASQNEPDTRVSWRRLLKKWLSMRAHQAYRWNPGLAVTVARRLPRRLVSALRTNFMQDGAAPPAAPQQESRAQGVQARLSQAQDQPGITLVGYARGEFGIAENMRYAASALTAADCPFDIFGIAPTGAYDEADSALSRAHVERSSNPVQLYCVNADQMPKVLMDLGPERTADFYRIGYWFWELAQFPQDWHGAFDMVDEVWAPSRFVQASLSRVSSKPVVHVPVAVDFRIRGTYSRAGFGLPGQAFLFLFSYDFHSFSQRKNPQAVIAAFQQAFPPQAGGVGLVIKTVYGEQHPAAFARLQEIARDDPRITIINRVLPRDEMYGLIDACDCYASLHRAEGFGLGLAEAMLLGKPVIGTAYSGNLDFMNADNSCLVDYKMVPVPPDAYPHWEGQEWAEPDIGHAAHWMRTLHEDAALRAALAARAQAWMRREHSFARVGQTMTERLRVIRSRRS